MHPYRTIRTPNCMYPLDWCRECTLSPCSIGNISSFRVHYAASYRRWTKYSNPGQLYPPRPPNFKVAFFFQGLRRVDKTNQTPQHDTPRTRSLTLTFGEGGVVQSFPRGLNILSIYGMLAYWRVIFFLGEAGSQDIPIPPVLISSVFQRFPGISSSLLGVSVVSVEVEVKHAWVVATQIFFIFTLIWGRFPF